MWSKRARTYSWARTWSCHAMWMQCPRRRWPTNGSRMASQHACPRGCWWPAMTPSCPPSPAAWSSLTYTSATTAPTFVWLPSRGHLCLTWASRSTSPLRQVSNWRVATGRCEGPGEAHQGRWGQQLGKGRPQWGGYRLFIAFTKHLLYARHCAQLWSKVVGKISSALLELGGKYFSDHPTNNCKLWCMRVRKEFPKIAGLSWDLREGQDFNRQRRAREGGRERQAKELACAKTLGQESTQTILSTERRVWLGECSELRMERLAGGQILQRIEVFLPLIINNDVVMTNVYWVFTMCSDDFIFISFAFMTYLMG